MTPLERLALCAICGALALLFGAGCVVLAHICTPGQLAILGFLFVGTCGWLGWCYGEQLRRNDIERRLKGVGNGK